MDAMFASTIAKLIFFNDGGFGFVSGLAPPVIGSALYGGTRSSVISDSIVIDTCLCYIVKIYN
jgi:hypothetical protein